MNINITMPQEMEKRLKRKAESERRSMEQVIIELLNDALETESTFPSPEEVVARIQATPPSPGSVRPASGSLAEALRHAPEDPDFDLATWNQAWADVEAEMQAITRANDIAEGRA
jgi:plasmid stability protein